MSCDMLYYFGWKEPSPKRNEGVDVDIPAWKTTRKETIFARRSYAFSARIDLLPPEMKSN